MSGGKPYIGCEMGLLSKAQNRYEGILYTIDTVNSTVVLAKVKCFGTEGRPTNRPTPPKDDIFDYITFRGSDIEDIMLHERSGHFHGLPRDPAIVQSSRGTASSLHLPPGRLNPGRMPFHTQLSATSVNRQPYAAARGFGPLLQGPTVKKCHTVEKAVQTVMVEELTQTSDVTAIQALNQDAGKPQRTARVSSRSRKGTGSTAKVKSAPDPPSAQPDSPEKQTKGEGENGPPPRKRAGARRHKNRSTGRLTVGPSSFSTLKFDTDFDFDSSNAQFIKEEREMQDGLSEGANGKEKEDQGDKQTKNTEDCVFGPKRYYDRRKSFFDNVPSSNNPRWTWAEERKQNLETFGVPGVFFRGQGFRHGRQGQETATLTSQSAGSGQK